MGAAVELETHKRPCAAGERIIACEVEVGAARVDTLIGARRPAACLRGLAPGNAFIPSGVGIDAAETAACHTTDRTLHLVLNEHTRRQGARSCRVGGGQVERGRGAVAPSKDSYLPPAFALGRGTSCRSMNSAIAWQAAGNQTCTEMWQAARRPGLRQSPSFSTRRRKRAFRQHVLSTSILYGSSTQCVSMNSLSNALERCFRRTSPRLRLCSCGER